jgi:8-oxo-dGTP pyrophosphatase MutT (NUDIX family)
MEKMRIVIIFIRNDEGKYFVHQRLSTKEHSPNLYGIGAGGRVNEGEEHAVAAARELKEETGLTTPVEYLFTEEFDGPDIYSTDYVYLTMTEDMISTDESEWQWSGWMTEEEVKGLAADRKLCPDTHVVFERYLAE